MSTTIEAGSYTDEALLHAIKQHLTASKSHVYSIERGGIFEYKRGADGETVRRALPGGRS